MYRGSVLKRIRTYVSTAPVLFRLSLDFQNMCKTCVNNLHYLYLYLIIIIMLVYYALSFNIYQENERICIRNPWNTVRLPPFQFHWTDWNIFYYCFHSCCSGLDMLKHNRVRCHNTRQPYRQT